jgi:hypothetical protein
MAHGDALKGKWVASTITLTWKVVYPAFLPPMRTPRLPAVDWNDASADLNGLIRFAERRNLVSVRVPSHFIWPLPQIKGAVASQMSLAVYQITPSHISYECKLERRILFVTQMKFQFKTIKCVGPNIFRKYVCVVRDGICITFLSLL